MEWTGARYADTPTVEVRRTIRAAPERVWELVTDIGLMPRLSDELQAAEWVGDRSGPEVGARFVGHSRHEAFGEWETTSYVVECTPHKVFAWAVADPELPSAVWRFTLDAQDEGSTGLTQWAQLGPGRSGLSYAIDRMPEKEQKIVHVRLQEFERNMGATLDALKALAEGTVTL
ncbi:SRPBCC family protein [Streptomyces sp. SID8379]|uniref:SRPBCC family protein n=1 Tax=unclassified Streptomyces TaxID=2593676 RepID=UPI00035D4454|nr:MULTISPECIES: SRPBCC family protein [unclassified Streptomyces]MYW63424.1 SRPBCC family protein [Streptomyces sp. SID8379]